jgi:hypothetical protein
MNDLIKYMIQSVPRLRVSATGPHSIGNCESEMLCMHGSDLQCYVKQSKERKTMYSLFK